MEQTEIEGADGAAVPVFVFSVKLPLLLTGHEAVKKQETRMKKKDGEEPSELFELTFKAVVDKENLIQILRLCDDHKVEATIGGSNGL